MKVKNLVTTAMLLGTLSMTAGLAIANTMANPTPAPFASLDTDKNGSIDEQEFNAMREQHQAQVKASGRMGKNMADAPTFARLDRDSNGLISKEELTAMQQGQRKGMGRGNGFGQNTAGKGQMNNRRGKGCGHQGSVLAMQGKMGQRYQAMDAETREKHDAFRAATTDLRQQIAAKRAEKQAVMHSVNPDPDQAAQLTRDLLELRSQLMAQAKEAGIEIAQAGANNRHGGRGHNHGLRL